MAYVNLGTVVYPVGSVYQSFSSTSPATIFGGTWSSITGRFLYANAGTSTGGSNTHTLTVNEMPAHQHGNSGAWKWECSVGFNSGAYNVPWQDNGNAQTLTSYHTGGGAAHNNMPAYQTVYTWRRTA